MSLVLNVELIGEYKKLTQATNGAKKQLSGLQKSTQSISNKINGAFAAIGIGLSFNVIKRELEEASKAAIEDVKSQELLANALKNTMKATDEQIASVEKQISKFQLSASVADDELRPAFSKLAIATGDVEKANELMAIALDTAAGTGKSLDTVVTAMSKALNGNEGALARLVPSVKGAKDPIAELAKTFDGAAEAAAKTDPYQRMNIIFGELQEQVGMALLPYLEQFSEWLASPGGQEKLQEIVDTIILFIEKMSLAVDFIIKYREQIGQLSLGIVGLTSGIKLASLAMGAFNLAMANPAFLAAAVVLGGIAAGMAIVAQNTRNATNEMDEFNRRQALMQQNTNPFTTELERNATLYKGILEAPKTPTPVTKVPVSQLPAKEKVGGTVVQNVTINQTKATAPEIVKELQKQSKVVGRQYLK